MSIVQKHVPHEEIQRQNGMQEDEGDRREAKHSIALHSNSSGFCKLWQLNPESLEPNPSRRAECHLCETRRFPLTPSPTFSTISFD